MAVTSSGSGGDRGRYRVSELPSHHFAALDDDTIGAMASRSALSLVSWTPDVAATVTDHLVRDAVAYPEQFASVARRPSVAAPGRPSSSIVGMTKPPLTRHPSRGLVLAVAGVAAAVVVGVVSLPFADRLGIDPSDLVAGRSTVEVAEQRQEAVPPALDPVVVAPAATEADGPRAVGSKPLTIVAAGPLRDGRIGARVRLEAPAGDVHQTQLLRKARSGAWQPMASANEGRSVETTLVPGKRYDFRVRALDDAGNLISIRRLRAVLTVRKWASEHIDRTPGDWTTTTGDPKLGGALASKSADAAITTSFKGDGVALVAPVGPSGGAMRIRVDGGEWVRGDLSDAAAADRAVVFSRTLENGAHSLDIGVADGVITLDSMMIVRTPEAWPPRS